MYVRYNVKNNYLIIENTTFNLKILFMARKTKEEAKQTREAILDAAEILFIRQGVSRTSLQQIAQFAQVTRGAVYWHFDDKLSLFQALLDRAVEPLDKIFAKLDKDPQPPYLNQLLSIAESLTDLICEDQRIRNFFDIVTYKIELVDDFIVMRERYLHHLNHTITMFSNLLMLAVHNNELQITINEANETARCMHAIMDGFFNIWMHAPDTLNLKKSVLFAFTVFIQGLKTQPLPQV